MSNWNGCKGSIDTGILAEHGGHSHKIAATGGGATLRMATTYLQSYSEASGIVVTAAAKAIILKVNQICDGQSEALLGKALIWSHPFAKGTWWAPGKILASTMVTADAMLGISVLYRLSSVSIHIFDTLFPPRYSSNHWEALWKKCPHSNKLLNSLFQINQAEKCL